jgi:hypothetical protein
MLIFLGFIGLLFEDVPLGIEHFTVGAKLGQLLGMNELNIMLVLIIQRGDSVILSGWRNVRHVSSLLRCREPSKPVSPWEEKNVPIHEDNLCPRMSIYTYKSQKEGSTSWFPAD